VHLCDVDCEACRRLQDALVDALAQRTLASIAPRELAAVCNLGEDRQRHRCGTLATCALAAFTTGADRIYGSYERAFAADQPWPKQFQQGVEGVVALFVEQPGLLRLCLVETEGVTIPALRAGRAWNRKRLVALLVREYRRQAGAGTVLPRLHFELLAGATCRLLEREYMAGRLAELRRTPSLIAQLVAVFEPVAA
jgi:hypothetical protein